MTQPNIETDTINTITELLETLSQQRTEFETWLAKQDPNLPAQEREWRIAKRKSAIHDASIDEVFAKQEPGLNALPTVVASKIKVANLKRDLANAESELSKLLELGTPQTTYDRTLDMTEARVTHLIDAIKHSRIEGFLLQSYGSADVVRLGDEIVNTVKLHPSVVRLDMIRPIGRSLSRQVDFTNAERERSYQRVLSGLGKLKNLLVSENAATTAPKSGQVDSNPRPAKTRQIASQSV
jgi:hypothetical protein